MAVQFEQIKKILNRKHLSEYSLEQLFTDMGLYEDVLLDCLPAKTSPTYISEDRLVEELIVSDDVAAFNELWTSKAAVLLTCPSCGKSEMTFNLKPAYKPKQEDKSKYMPSETNVFEKQHKYCLGRNELGIVDDSQENRENWEEFCRRRADDCKNTIFAITDLRKEGNCSLDYSHRYISDFIIIDPEIDYNNLPDNIKKVVCGEKEKDEGELEFVNAYNKLKHCLIIRKIGQFPSQAESQLLDTSKYRKVLRDKYKDYTLGIQLNASGVGAGALVYLRRIFEGLLEESHQRCVQLDNWDEAVYKDAHVDEKIKMVEDRNEIIIPKELQAIRKKFYGALSKGIHELPENECKELFPAFRYVIESVLDARIAKIEHDKKRNEMMKVINSIKG